MPKNPFAPIDGTPNRIKRNAFDLSKQSFNTTEFGRLLPILCQEVIPGDSFEIDSNVSVRAMPTVFPLQTRIRGSVSYFYVRNRTLCDEWEDFIFKTKDRARVPWLQLDNSRAKQMISTGSLGDSLGVPSTVGTADSIEFSFHFSSFKLLNRLRPNFQTTYNISEVIATLVTEGELYEHTYDFLFSRSTYDSLGVCYGTFSDPITYDLPSDFSVNVFITPSPSGNVIASSFADLWGLVLVDSNNIIRYGESVRLISNTTNPFYYLNPSDNFISEFNNLRGGRKAFRIGILYNGYNGSGALYQSKPISVDGISTNVYYIPNNSSDLSFDFQSTSFTGLVDSIMDSTEDSVIGQNPFVGQVPQIPLNALPFRAYTMICNYFFRNDLNNPYVLNGEVQYNKFIPSTAGGPDTNVYDFYYKNWEMDQFTSALQTPQFGEAPLVGLTVRHDLPIANFEFESESGDKYHASVAIDDEGKMTSISDFSQNIPSGNLRNLMELINYGISINDLRNVNSFQRFLENTMRRGLRYRNQLKSHLGVSVDFPDIDVPQYIGGYSAYLIPGQNTNLADSPDAGLGDFNGSLGGTIASSNKIRCYCPEHGFIIGIFSLSPIPLYSQAIPKHFLKTDAFDYFQAEFSKPGFVPIHYSEVTPLQNRGQNQSPSDIFAYQKAWYDYMANLDSAHGDFRTTLQQFTIGRTFESRPTLVEDFVRIKPEQLNDIFVTNNIADRYNSNAKFLLNIYHKIIALRPIPRNGVPALE